MTISLCLHSRELYDRFDDGTAALRCARCMRLRPHPLAAEPVRYHRTQEGGSTSAPTGIERAQAEAQEQLRVIAQYEREQRLFVVGERVRRRYEGRA